MAAPDALAMIARNPTAGTRTGLVAGMNGPARLPTRDTQRDESPVVVRKLLAGKAVVAAAPIQPGLEDSNHRQMGYPHTAMAAVLSRHIQMVRHQPVEFSAEIFWRVDVAVTGIDESNLPNLQVR